MNLPFSTVLNGKPTYFIDKIWQGLIQNNLVNYKDLIKVVLEHRAKFGQEWDHVPGKALPAKIHTIRKVDFDWLHFDGIFRFKPEDKIHFVINNRTKNRFQFAPVLPVRSIQFLTFDYSNNSKYPDIHIGNYVDGSFSEENVKIFSLSKMHFEYITFVAELALNDGFENFEDFLAYFDMDGIYKIIHWTNKLY